MPRSAYSFMRAATVSGSPTSAVPAPPRTSPTPPVGDDTGAVKTFEVRLPVTVTDKKKKKKSCEAKEKKSCCASKGEKKSCEMKKEEVKKEEAK